MRAQRAGSRSSLSRGLIRDSYAGCGKSQGVVQEGEGTGLRPVPSDN